MPDVVTQLRAYRELLEEETPEITMADVEHADTSSVRPVTQTVRVGVLVALAAAVVTILLFGIGPLLFGGEQTPPANSVVPTTSPAVTPTTNPEVVPTTTPVATTEAPSTDPVDGDAIGLRISVGESPCSLAGAVGGLWVGECRTTEPVGDGFVDSGGRFVHLLDGNTNRVIATVDLGSAFNQHDGRERPREAYSLVAATDLWVGDSVFGDIFHIDGETGTVLATIDVTGIDEGSGANALVAVSGDSIWATGSTGGDQSVVYRIDPETGGVDAVIPVEGDLWNGLVAADSGVWVFTWGPRSDDGRDPFFVTRIDGVTNQVVWSTDVSPLWPAFGGDLVFGHGYLWAIGSEECSCRGIALRISPETGEINGEIEVGVFPLAMAVGERWIWFIDTSSEGERTVLRIDPNSTRIVGGPITFDDPPVDLQIVGNVLWVSHGSGGYVTRITLSELP